MFGCQFANHLYPSSLEKHLSGMQVNSLQKFAGRWIRACAITGAMLGPVVARAQAPTTIHLEAENAILRGPVLLTATPGYLGTGYVGEFDISTDSVIFRFPAQASRYNLTIRYTSPNASKTTSVAVNGIGASKTLSGTGPAFGSLAAGTYVLPVGTSTVAIAAFLSAQFAQPRAVPLPVLTPPPIPTSTPMPTSTPTPPQAS